MDNGNDNVTLAGTEYPLVLPSFAVREEIAIGYYIDEKERPNRQRRVGWAAIGLCVPGLKLSAGFAEGGYDLIAYGGTVYEALRERGIERSPLIEAASACIVACALASFPRAGEVADQVDFSAASAEPGTSTR